ncbi:hypothetical protein LQW54_005094 [Pestalotiopsis sp. IQ-011]
MMHHDQPSPATSNATNRSGTNRGGRPREWTPPRARRLTRLYCYTSLKVDEILKVLEDDIWSPGKEAANKHLNHLLGKDPRWMRPRDIGEARQRMAGLKSSDRARSSSQSSSQNPMSPVFAMQDPMKQSYQRTDTMDSKSFGRSSSSSLEKNDMFAFGGLPYRGTTTFDIPPPARQSMGARNLQTMNNPSHTSFFRVFPGIGRQGTSMTTSTDFSVGSTKESWHSMKNKLDGYQKSDVKDIFRLLKRYTMSNEDGGDQQNSSPRSAMGTFNHPSINNFRGQTEGVTSPSVAKYLLPGDLIATAEPVVDPTTYMDQFGNTLYHLVAASTDIVSLFQLIRQEPSPQYAPLNATNSGGQTFLHVLHDNWFEEDSPLSSLVEDLKETQFNFSATDVYGRTFFHILREKLKANSGLMREITGRFGNNMNLLNRRDAFGVKPMILRASTLPMNRAEARPMHLTIPGTTDRTQQKITEHTQLLKIITGVNATEDGFSREDSQGRNALHCLSEVILDIASIDTKTANTKPRKRKMDDQNEPVLQTCPLSHRLQYLETVLQANVDVNHYNASGDTVLMSFISHIIDGQDDKDLEQLIDRLLIAGANIEARNRNGETVLQVAARLGQKFAVRVLLKHGANFHVRNCDGRSVLQTIDDHTRMSGDDDEALARLEATRGVLSGRFSNSKAVQEPTLLDQWSLRPPPQSPKKFG